MSKEAVLDILTTSDADEAEMLDHVEIRMQRFFESEGYASFTSMRELPLSADDRKTDYGPGFIRRRYTAIASNTPAPAEVNHWTKGGRVLTLKPGITVGTVELRRSQVLDLLKEAGYRAHTEGQA